MLPCAASVQAKGANDNPTSTIPLVSGKPTAPAIVKAEKPLRAAWLHQTVLVGKSVTTAAIGILHQLAFCWGVFKA
jgi:hypothetical protein